MKRISILFTQKQDRLSRFLFRFYAQKYSHVSLSLETDDPTFYSFNVKGFAKENLEKFRRRGVKNSVLYQIEVTDEVYAHLHRMLEDAKEQGREMKYSPVGVVFCLLRIPYRQQNRYFCSQFVAELLSQSSAVKLKRRPSLYLPDHLRMELSRLVQPTCSLNVV